MSMHIAAVSVVEVADDACTKLQESFQGSSSSNRRLYDAVVAVLLQNSHVRARVAGAECMPPASLSLSGLMNSMTNSCRHVSYG